MAELSDLGVKRASDASSGLRGDATARDILSSTRASRQKRDVASAMEGEEANPALVSRASHDGANERGARAAERRPRARRAVRRAATATWDLAAKTASPASDAAPADTDAAGRVNPAESAANPASQAVDAAKKTQAAAKAAKRHASRGKGAAAKAARTAAGVVGAATEGAGGKGPCLGARAGRVVQDRKGTRPADRKARQLEEDLELRRDKRRHRKARERRGRKGVARSKVAKLETLARKGAGAAAKLVGGLIEPRLLAVSAASAIVPVVAIAPAGIVMMATMTSSAIASTSSASAVIEQYLAKAEQYASDDTIGYSQGSRYHNPNMDCSSFVYYCLVDSGVCKAEELGASPFTTYGMKAIFEGLEGWQVLEYTGTDMLQRGDILLREGANSAHGDGHTEIYAGDMYTYGAHSASKPQADQVNYQRLWATRAKTDWEYVIRPLGRAGARRIEIPEPYGSGGYTITGYADGWWSTSHRRIDPDSAQMALNRLWVAAGARYDDGIAVLNGRYLIACTPKFGAVGDMVDWQLDDGTTIRTTVADEKGADAQSEWGHGGGLNVLEFEVDADVYYQRGNPGTSRWKPEWGGHRVCAATNLGSVM